MAVISKTITRAEPYADAWAISWTVSTGDDGSPVKMPMANDRSVQVTGTFATSTVVIQGSNDGTNWHKRHFAGVSSDGRAMVFDHGRTSWSSDGRKSPWNYCVRDGG